MTEQNKLHEEITAADIATTDENLSALQMFQQTALPSLGRQIFSVIPMSGPTAALFNIKKKDAEDSFELLRNEVEVYASTPISTGVTKEAIQDLRSQYGKEASMVVGTLLRGLANDDENTKTLAFLDAEAKAETGLTLSDSLNAETNLFEITQKVHELILAMNNKNMRTFEAFAVIPAAALGGIMGLKGVMDTTEARGLFVAQIGLTKFYLNPDATSTTAYVGLKDTMNPSKSSAVFSPYVTDIVEVADPDTGEMNYHIFNRYAITKSPLHVTDNEMLYKFTITV